MRLMISLTGRVKGVKAVRIAFLICVHLIITYRPISLFRQCKATEEEGSKRKLSFQNSLRRGFLCDRLNSDLLYFFLCSAKGWDAATGVYFCFWIKKAYWVLNEILLS